MINTINDVINFIEKEPNNPTAFNYKDYSGTWQAVSTQQFIHEVRCIVAALQKIGLRKGDRVAIIGPVSYFWSLCDIGIMLAGCVTVPIFHNISSDNFVYEVVQSGAKVIFVADASCHLLCQENCELFQKIISMDEAPYCPEEIHFKEFFAWGEQALKELNGKLMDSEAATDDLATIIYTSGTTALPKGVMLTQKNMVAEVDYSQKWFGFGQKNDRYLSYLPLAHIFGRLMNIYMIYAGVSIYYLGDPLQFVQASQEVHPTTLIIVPRIIDKIYKSILHKIHDMHGLKKKLALWAVNVAESNKQTWGWKLQHRLADHILYAKLRNLLGNCVRVIISGSAKANPKQLKFFHTIGIPIYEGYGMTEGCPVSTNTSFATRFGTIGKPMPEIEIKIAESGEILIRGPVVMMGYYKDEKLSDAKLDSEGWFHSGDKGSIDADGYLTFLGRLSELCKTSYGEFVDVPNIERLLSELPYVDMAILIAHNKPFVTSLLFPNIEALERIKKQRGLEHLTAEEVLKQDFIKHEIDQALDNLNQHLSNWERIRDYRLIPAKASIEGGELSPTLKQRRQFIEEKYKYLIDEMYPEHLIAVNF